MCLTYSINLLRLWVTLIKPTLTYDKMEKLKTLKDIYELGDISAEIEHKVRQAHMKDKRVRCVYCDKPIHSDNWAGATSKGLICGDSVCLMKLAQEMEEELKL